MDDELAQSPPKFQLRVLAKQSAKLIINAITPPKCLVCRTSIQDGAALCIECWQKLNFLEHPVCDVLGTPFAYDQGQGALSAAALADPPPWQRSRGAVAFDDASKPIIYALKYRDNAEAGLFMARMMSHAGRDLIKESDIIIPVPLHFTRLWKRRFNQAVELARPIAKSAGIPMATDVLLRTKATPPQVGLKSEARHKNMRNAFAVAFQNQPRISGKKILLIDDVRTTGATLAACTEVLQSAGAAQVFVLSFATVLEPHRIHIDA